MSKKVYLCPSNQWANPYAFGGTNEGIQMNVVADLVRDKLKEYDVEILRSDNALGYKQHCEIINSIMPDVCICIHSNGFNRSVTGTETLYIPAVKGSKEFAQMVQNKVTAVMPSINRGVFNGTYPLGRNVGYMNRLKCVSALTELEYHDVANTAFFIIDNKDRYAQAVTDSIVEYLSLQKKYVAPVEPVPVPTPLNFADGDLVKVNAGAKYVGGTQPSAWVYKCVLYVRKVQSNGQIHVSTDMLTPSITGVFYADSLTKVGHEQVGTIQTPTATHMTVSTSFMPLILNSLDLKRKLASMPKGASVELVESGSKWTKVKYNGLVGYAATQYLK